jgi:lysophospholipase L1-like esterase
VALKVRKFIQVMRDWLVSGTFWLLAVLSLPFAIWVRLSALRLDEASGDSSGATGSGTPIQLMAAGDSIIAGVGVGVVEASLPVLLAEELASKGHRVEWQLHGENGARIAQLCAHLETAHVHSAPDFLLISIGVNDVTGLTFVSAWRSRLNQLFTIINRRFPETRIIFAGLPPMGLFPVLPQPLRFTLGLRAEILDRTAREVVSRTPLAIHVPTEVNPTEMSFCEDGFHPDASSCRIWATHLAMLVLDTFQPPSPGDKP